MDVTPLKVVLLILHHHKIPVCLVGEWALNYYNVPRVIHDIEVCVPDLMLQKAASLLLSTGLFATAELPEFNTFTEYKKGFPRMCTAGWASPVQNIVILPTSLYDLDPLEGSLVSPLRASQTFSKQLTDMISDHEIASLPMPRLAPLAAGLARRFLSTNDDASMIALEQLVDGMDLDEAWCTNHLRGYPEETVRLVESLVDGKPARIDYFSEHTVTSFVRDEDEAKQIRRIPGRD